MPADMGLDALLVESLAGQSCMGVWDVVEPTSDEMWEESTEPGAVERRLPVDVRRWSRSGSVEGDDVLGDGGAVVPARATDAKGSIGLADNMATMCSKR